LKEAAESFVSSHLGVDAQYHSGFANDVASHAYAHQLIVSYLNPFAQVLALIYFV
jgi:hypothetical protein